MKTDILHKLLKVIDYERYKIIGLILAVVIVVAVNSCQVRLVSPLSGQKVNQQRFNIEVIQEKDRIEAIIAKADSDLQALLANAEITNAEFAKWQQVKDGLFKTASGVVTTFVSGGTINAAQVAASIVGLGGLAAATGGVLDANRKNKIIEKAKSSNDAVV